MKPVIADLTNSSPDKLKPIELVSCLQNNQNANGQYFFYNGFYERDLKAADKITRLSIITLGKSQYDLIKVEVEDVENIFLGHWNDGVVTTEV